MPFSGLRQFLEDAHDELDELEELDEDEDVELGANVGLLDRFEGGALIFDRDLFAIFTLTASVLAANLAI